MGYKRYWVFVPLTRHNYLLNAGTPREARVDTYDQIKQIKEEWKLYKHKTSVRYLGDRYDLGKVGMGDVVFVHAHGYTNDGLTIGGSFGVQSSSPQALLALMVQKANLSPDTINLTIKLWTCFSGFQFAEKFYELATQDGHFPGLVVDGYMGETRTTQPQKTVRYKYINRDDKLEPIAPWLVESMQESGFAIGQQVGRAKGMRVRHGAHE